MNVKFLSATAVIALTLGAGAMAAMDPMVGGAADVSQQEHRRRMR